MDYSCFVFGKTFHLTEAGTVGGLSVSPYWRSGVHQWSPERCSPRELYFACLRLFHFWMDANNGCPILFCHCRGFIAREGVLLCLDLSRSFCTGYYQLHIDLVCNSACTLTLTPSHCNANYFHEYQTMHVYPTPGWLVDERQSARLGAFGPRHRTNAITRTSPKPTTTLRSCNNKPDLGHSGVLRQPRANGLPHTL